MNKKLRSNRIVCDRIFLIFPAFLICFLSISSVFAQSKVLLKEKEVVMPTYTVSPPEKNPVFFRNEAFQGASRHYYPLKMNDQYTGERIEKEWKTVVLENEYIELGITPEIGGKLYYANDKTNGFNFIYRNNVVKPSNVGMTGAWVSGGIEWCVGHHHRASTFLPINYSTKENGDGSKTIYIGEYEPRHGMRWIIGVTVFPGKSYFKAEGWLYNSSPFTHTFLYWANLAVHANENFQTIFPPSAQVATYHSKTNFTHWPISHEVYRGSDFTQGVDISWWKNTKESNSFFVHELQENFMGGYDHGKESGIVHIGDHNIVRGAKLWQWGSGARGQATEARLTENDGPYAELMAGAFSDNQPDYSWIKPYEVKHWKQYWYPIRGIQGFKNANLNGAVNLEEKKNNCVFLGYYSTQRVNNARVILKNKDKIVFERDVEISPDNPFSETIKMDGAFNITDLYTELVNTDTKELLVNYQPVELEPVELPETWKGYPAPEKLETVEDLFLTGKRVELFYAPQYDEMDWYMEALNRDPDDIRSNTAVGNHYLKNGDYKKARKYLGHAIKMLTNDYTRPTDCEALYLQGLTLKSLGLYTEAIDTLYRATWDYAFYSPAYLQLAQISTKNGDFEKALFQIEESLSTNTRNNRAIALKASIQRRLGDFEGALTTLQPVYEKDPLDFRIKNEYYLAVKESGNRQKAKDIISTLNKEMRSYDENYLELAVEYVNDGLLKEAEEILLRFNRDNPIFDYYLGFIYNKYGNSDKASTYFNAAKRQSVDYIFPYRLETIDVLKTALKYNPNDGNAYYYMGNILYEKQPAYAIECWENAVTHIPNMAVAYRNLGWGYYRHYEDVSKAIPYYEKAISLNKKEAIYYAELCDLYELDNTPIKTRMKLFKGDNEAIKNRDDAYMWQIQILTLSDQPERAVKLLDGVEFAYREGESRNRDININVYLTMGNKYFKENDYKKALEYYLKAQVPEEAASNARFGNRNTQVYYYIGLAHEALGNKLKAKSFYKKAVEEKKGGMMRRRASIMTYYKGLSYSKLGDNKPAKEVFNSMIKDGNRQLEGSRESEVGVIFGERMAENNRLSQAYTIRGLGQKGLGQIRSANKDLKRATGLLFSNLWAKTELGSN